MEKNQNKMGVLPEGKLLFNMALPLCVSMLVQALYNTVDSIFVSRLSEDALAAVSIATPVQLLIIAFATGTAIGMNSLISRRLGEGRTEDANNAANNGIFVLLLTSLLFTLFGLFGVRPFFTAYTEETAIRELGIEYLSICTTFSIGIFMQIGCERILQSQGQNNIAMIMQLVGAVFNIIFDPILIFGLLGFPALGMRGAAIATVSGQFLSMFCCFGVLLLKKLEVKPNLRCFHISGPIIRQIYQVGFPSIIMQAIGTVMNLLMCSLLLQYSTAAVAFFGAYFKLQSLIFMPIFGLTNASMSIMAYNFGARSKPRVMRTWKLTMLSAVIFMTAGLIFFLIFPVPLLRLFDASDEMLRIGTPGLRIMASCFVTAACGITNSTLFQAIGKGFYSMLVSLLRQLIVLIPAAYLLSWLFGTTTAIWVSFPIAELVSFIYSFLLMRKVYKERIVPLDYPLEVFPSQL